MTVSIAYDQALEALKWAVNHKGWDYIYQTPECFQYGEYMAAGNKVKVCAYYDTKNLAPACIVGHVLHYLGVPYREVVKCNRGNSVEDLHNKNIIHLDTDAMVLLTRAQSMQDTGHTWGQALAEALKTVEYERQKRADTVRVGVFA